MNLSFDSNIYDEDENRRKGWLISISLHLLLLLLFLFPFFLKSTVVEEFQGVLVVFGNPNDQSNGPLAQIDNIEDNSSSESEEAETEDLEIEEKEEVEQIEEEFESFVEEELEVEEVDDSEPEEIEVIAELTEDVAEMKATENELLQQKRLKEETEKQRKEQEELERKKIEEAQKKAEEEKLIQEANEKAAKKRAEAEKAEKEKKEYEASKKQFGDLFNNGNADSGKEEGSQGDPMGDPKGEGLEGISTGQGKIGGGISSRGVLFEPKISENSQKQGKVVVKVCVNKDGQVIESKFTQRGSTTIDRSLVAVAEDAAKKYQFTPSEQTKQCGTITINFKLQ